MFVSRKSILVSKGPNQFPSCWFHDPEEVMMNIFQQVRDDKLKFENKFQNDNSQTPPPSYDLEATKASMDFTTNLCNAIKNVNSEEDEWEAKILKYGWSQKHIRLFNQVVKILDYDRLARLANVDNKRYEAVQRRAAIDKSADRMRKVLSTVHWDTQLVQWIHGLMMEFLPPSYLAAYIDIMQTLKNKLPSLVDKMIFWKPGNVNQDLLAPILKRPWQPALNNKVRICEFPSRIFTNFCNFSTENFPGMFSSSSFHLRLHVSRHNRHASRNSTRFSPQWRQCFLFSFQLTASPLKNSRCRQSRSKPCR